MVNAHLHKDVDGRHVIVQLTWIRGVGSTRQSRPKHKSKISRAHLVLCTLQRHTIKEMEEKAHDRDDLRREGVDNGCEGIQSTLVVFVSGAVYELVILVRGEQWSVEFPKVSLESAGNSSHVQLALAEAGYRIKACESKAR